jgi:hypothetical protein
MKKVLITLALTVAVVSTGLAQGLINWNNSNGSKISVNSVIGGAPTGTTPAYTSATFYYALFYSASATTVGGLSTALMPLANGVNGTYAFQDANWTFNNPGVISGYVTGPAYGTNAAAGRFTPENTDVSQGATITSFTTPAQWVVLGWSASDGTSLAELATWYNGGHPATSGWIGESAVSAAISPGNPLGSPPGTPQPVFPGAFTLGLVTVPEPSTIALAGLGALSLLLFRRRK